MRCFVGTTFCSLHSPFVSVLWCKCTGCARTIGLHWQPRMVGLLLHMSANMLPAGCGSCSACCYAGLCVMLQSVPYVPLLNSLLLVLFSPALSFSSTRHHAKLTSCCSPGTISPSRGGAKSFMSSLLPCNTITIIVCDKLAASFSTTVWTV